MIEIKKICKSKPYKKFIQFYEMAINGNQKNIEAIAISSYSKTLNQVNSRFVNVKYIEDKEFIFFLTIIQQKQENLMNINRSLLCFIGIM